MLMRLKNRAIKPFAFGWPYSITTPAGEKIEVVAATFLGQFGIVAKVERILRANKMDVPPNLADIIEDQIARRIPNAGRRPSLAASIIRSSAAIISGTQTLLALTMRRSSEKRFVEQEEAERRAEVCLTMNDGKACPYNRKDACFGCDGIYTLVKIWFRGKKTTKDDRLFACNVCGCLNSAQVHVQSDILLAGTKPVIAAQYPLGCWKRVIVAEKLPPEDRE